MTRSRPRARRRSVVAVAVVLALVLVAAGAVFSNAFGAKDRLREVAERIELMVDPPPDRPIAATVLVTPRPNEPADDEDAADASPGPSGTPSATPSTAPGEDPADPTPTAKPTPGRVSVDVNLFKHPENHFISEQFDHTWCAVAGTQMVLNMWGKAPLTVAFQKQLASGIGQWESRRDSHNGGWGPSAMVAALASYGVPGYEVRAYETRGDALFDAAKAIEKTHAPVLLLAWRGAHTWVMTGFRADADPLLFDDAHIDGAYINDPWFPIISSIWGASDPPGSFEDRTSMRINYLPWKRPEGSYPDRDGLFIAVVPTKPDK
jgi:hypothetical protein